MITPWILNLLICVFIIAIIRYYWSRKHLYYLSWKLHGPLAFPFIGNAYKFICPNKGNINNRIKM